MSLEEIEKLNAEKERNEREIQQLEHQIDRLENRAAYLTKKERSARTHQLCNIGGVVEHFIPEVKTMDRSEIYTLVERITAVPMVQTILQNLRR